MRLVVRECGAALAFTEMVSVNGLVRDGKKSFELMRSAPEDRPLGVQLFGDDPDILAEGARMAESFGDLIDINMGCPVKKVVGTGAGSALLRDPSRIRRIMSQVRKATKLPLTVKIRSGWQAGDRTFLEVGKIAEDEGCDAVVLHPRTRMQMFEGRAERSHIRELKESLSIPVIGNGDIFSAADALSLLQETGCDGVMIARGVLGNPWIFTQTLNLLQGKPVVPVTPSDRLQTALRHMQAFIELAGEKVAVREMRKHAAWYAHGLPSAARFRDLVNRIETKEALTEAIHDFFAPLRAA